MKTLTFEKDEKTGRITVVCADGSISVHSKCSYCLHCRGIYIGKRLAPTPQVEALNAIRRGTASDDSLMNAGMMFNTFVRDGQAIACDDDANAGFSRLY